MPRSSEYDEIMKGGWPVGAISVTTIMEMRDEIKRLEGTKPTLEFGKPCPTCKAIVGNFQEPYG